MIEISFTRAIIQWLDPKDGFENHYLTQFHKVVAQVQPSKFIECGACIFEQ